MGQLYKPRKAGKRKTQHEAVRIAAGTTILVSLNTLHVEICWESLEKRRNNHKLTLFYKLKANLTPSYLSDLYNLRNTAEIQTIHARIAQYFNSFLPSTIRDWNQLSPEAAQSDSIDSLYITSAEGKKFLVPKYYYKGNRHAQTLHTRLRTKCSY